MNFILKIWFWITFIRNRNSLPSQSTVDNPEMKYEVMSGSFIWEDEGLWDLKNYVLGEAFKHVIHHRMSLVIGTDTDVGAMRTKRFDKSIYNMAKRYFPNWIGFHPSRCQYNHEVADRMKRIRKVADRNVDRFFDESDKMNDLG